MVSAGGQLPAVFLGWMVSNTFTTAPVTAWQAPLWKIPTEGSTECAGGLTAVQRDLTSWGNRPTGTSESTAKRNVGS